MRKARVLLYGIEAGTLEETDEGARFTYSKSWLTRPGAVPVSVTLPLRNEVYMDLIRHRTDVLTGRVATARKEHP